MADPTKEARQAAAKEIAAIEKALTLPFSAGPNPVPDKILSLSDEEVLKQAGEIRLAEEYAARGVVPKTPIDDMSVSEFLEHVNQRTDLEYQAEPFDLLDIEKRLNRDLDYLSTTGKYFDRPVREVVQELTAKKSRIRDPRTGELYSPGAGFKRLFSDVERADVKSAKRLLRKLKTTPPEYAEALQRRASDIEKQLSDASELEKALAKLPTLPEEQLPDASEIKKALAKLPTLPPHPNLPSETPAKPPGGFKKFLKKLPFFGTAVTAAMIPGEVQAAYDRGGETEAAKTLAVELARMGDPGVEMLHDLAVAVPEAADAIARMEAAASMGSQSRPAREQLEKGEKIMPPDPTLPRY